MARNDEVVQAAIAARVAELLAEAPPLTDEQREAAVRILAHRPTPASHSTHRNAA